jgi:hypothetical protein
MGIPYFAVTGRLCIVRFTEKTMIAAYVRTSTRRQKDDSQRSEINKWFAANGIAPEKVEWYADQ